ncbi:hypothetical protein CALCODRAFT_180103 [Calocera cornea HHB12733]|uniref:Uncharacterized protein n=1 Tax=Calocera cornea HHB12733 TaxID=1353952 RepID=A0A165CC98_9BASI|nr:hypothetical protein CALCODRAFT_180103 [Calocera cornea HHB12733]
MERCQGALRASRAREPSVFSPSCPARVIRPAFRNPDSGPIALLIPSPSRVSPFPLCQVAKSIILRTPQPTQLAPPDLTRWAHVSRQQKPLAHDPSQGTTDGRRHPATRLNTNAPPSVEAITPIALLAHFGPSSCISPEGAREQVISG